MHSDAIELPSDRKFGFFIAVVAVVVALYLAFSGAHAAGGALALLALVAALVTLLRPAVLHPFNKAWMALGLLLGKVMSPLVFGLIFFALITPMAIVLRLAGRDELRLKRIAGASYWKPRAAGHLAPSSFQKQY